MKPESEKHITLTEWAASLFARVPHPNTLRKWARERQIEPAPQKVGRDYMVLPSARYVSKTKE